MSSEPNPPPAAQAPGRCFVCLTDEEPSDVDEWVRPCPCTLEGHQSCMLQFIDELDREHKPYECPICKTPIQVYSPAGALVRVHEGICDSFARASPIILGAGSLSGTIIGLSTYGMLAFRTVAGWEALKHFLQPHSGTTKSVLHFLSLSVIAPALILKQSLPVVGRAVVNPVAFIYGLYGIAVDNTFFTWPPSPEAAFTALPFIHTFYTRTWSTFLRPYELRFERRAAGLPDPQPERRRRRQQDPRPAPQGQAAGGIIGLLDFAINLLDVPDVDIEVEIQEEEVQEGQPNRFEIQIEDLQAIHDAPRDEEARAFVDEVLGRNDMDADTDEEMPELQDMPVDHGAGDAVEDWQDAAPAPVVQQHPAPAQAAEPALQPNGGGGGGDGGGNIQWDLTSALLNLAGAIASDLLLPAVASVSGELLRLTLPKRITAAAPAGYQGRPGLLQQMWGRSVVGGGLFIVARDLLRFYIKYRKAKARPQRRVRSVKRERSKSGGSSPVGA